MRRISVRKLPIDPGPAGWNRLLPEPGPADPLQGNATADWLVIGAGFAGLAAARRLSQLCPGDQVTILEAARVGDGPAGRNSGLMIDVPHSFMSGEYGGTVEADIAETGDNRKGIEFAAGMAAEYGLGDDVFVQSGKINAAASERGECHNRAYARHLEAMGEPCRMLDAKEMQALTGSRYYRSGLFAPGAATIQPAAFVRGVAAGLRSNRVAIHESSPVTDLVQEGDWIATTPRGRVVAPRVILAVNGHLNSFGFLKGRLVHLFTYASMTRKLTLDEVNRLGGRRTWALAPADPMGTTVRRISGIGGDRIVVRNRFTFEPSLEIDHRKIDRVAKDHDRAYARRFPMLPGIPMEYRWGGRLCLSRNGVQVIRELEEGLYCACCQNGLGTVKGTLAGLLAAEMANGVESPSLQRALEGALPKRLPPGPVASIGAKAYIRWSEHAAGSEL